jgi:hypothetical protein
MSDNYLVFMSPGTGATKDAAGTSDDSGYITGTISGVTSMSDLWTSSVPMPSTLPGGSGLPLVATRRQFIGGGQAKVVGVYRRPSSRFMPKTQIDPLAITIERFTDPTTGDLALKSTEGRWVKVAQSVTLERISYHVRKYSWSDAKGSWTNNHKGKINGNAFTVGDQAYTAKSLRFDGFRLRHYNWGGYNIYDMRFDFMHNPAMWVEEYDVTWTGAAWELQVRDMAVAIAFPALPS